MNFDQVMQVYYKERAALGIGVKPTEDGDICECGDYRRDHPNGGPCNLNGLGHGIPNSEPNAKCLKFRLSQRSEGEE